MTEENQSTLNILDLIKCEYVTLTDGNDNKYFIILAGPAKGVLYITENSPDYISGQVRVRGRDGGRYPYNYLEMIDHIFGKEENTIEVCSGSIKGRNATSTASITSIQQRMNPLYHQLHNYHHFHPHPVLQLISIPILTQTYC